MPEKLVKTYQFPLLPRPGQEKDLRDILYHTRQLYNAALEERIGAHKRRKRLEELDIDAGKALSLYDQQKALKDIRVTNPEFARFNSRFSEYALIRLDKAFKAFFRRVKAAKGKAGFPRFKSAARWDCIEFDMPRCKYTPPTDGEKYGLLSFKGVRGKIRVKANREIAGAPKFVRITRTHKGWMVGIAAEYDAPQPSAEAAGGMVGVDVGIEHFLTTSAGEHYKNPRIYANAQRTLRVAQRSLARKKRGGSGRKKAVVQVRRLHFRVRNLRNNWHWQEVRRLLAGNAVVAVEDLQVRNMLQNRHLAKAISDVAWSDFINKLSGKAAEAGKTVVKVPAKNTSQHCSSCGEKVQKSLSQRMHDCPSCGLSLQRDHNAAINILNQAVQSLGRDKARGCPVPCGGARMPIPAAV